MTRNPFTAGLAAVLSLLGAAVFLVSLLLENRYYRIVTAIVLLALLFWIAL